MFLVHVSNDFFPIFLTTPLVGCTVLGLHQWRIKRWRCSFAETSTAHWGSSVPCTCRCHARAMHLACLCLLLQRSLADSHNDQRDRVSRRSSMETGMNQPWSRYLVLMPLLPSKTESCVALMWIGLSQESPPSLRGLLWSVLLGSESKHEHCDFFTKTAMKSIAESI